MRCLALTCLLLAACVGNGVDETPLLDVHEPSATVELLPGGEVAMSWTVTGDGAELVITLIPLDEPSGFVIFDDAVAEGPGGFTWDGRSTQGGLVPPDVYDLDFTLYFQGAPADTALRNLSVHGVVVTDPAPGELRVILGSEGETDVHYVTVSQRVIWLTTSLDPDLDTDGDEIPFDERTIPGEFVPFLRTIHFDGADLDGLAIPGGVYRLVVDALDDDAPDLAYRAIGGTVDWRPLE